MGEVVFSDCINVLWGVWGAYDFYLILDVYSTVHSFLAPQESREVEIHACGLCAPRMSLSLFAFLHWGVVGLALAGKVGRLPKDDGYPLCYAFLFCGFVLVHPSNRANKVVTKRHESYCCVSTNIWAPCGPGPSTKSKLTCLSLVLLA